MSMERVKKAKESKITVCFFRESKKSKSIICFFWKSKIKQNDRNGRNILCFFGKQINQMLYFEKQTKAKKQMLFLLFSEKQNAQYKYKYNYK